MSFESVFERWLHKKGMDGEQDSSDGQEEEEKQQQQQLQGSEDAIEKEMPMIEREVWKEGDMEDMPVLQKMVDLPSAEEGRKLRSPPPPPLQITLSLSDACQKGRQNKHSDNGSYRNQPKHTKGQDTEEKTHNRVDDIQQKDESEASLAHKGSGKNCVIHHLGNTGKKTDSELQQKNHHQCHKKSALTELTDLNHSNSPSMPRDTEVDPVLSPDRDMPMEPDSTSEFVCGSAKWHHRRKESETSRGEASPWQVSPRSTGCAGPATPGSNNSEGLVRIEESLAECDSTSMFIASPSAISPASQGEIEERVCPVLADQEDSASPGHCVCRCKSLPPPADLISRDHPPASSSARPHLSVSTVNTASGKQSCSESWTCLVNRMHSFDDDPAPDLERVAPSLDLMSAPTDMLQREHDSPPILTLSEQESRIKQLRVEHSQSKDIPPDASPLEAPPLISFDAVPSQLSNRDFSQCSPPVLSSNDVSPHDKYTDCPPALGSGSTSSDDKCGDKPLPVLSKNGHALNARSSKSRKALCIFANNIDWNTAVAETVESPPSVANYDGENKPGIILKIRAKAAIPCTELAPEPKHHNTSVSASNRKRPPIDNADIMSRLRKRHKTEDAEKVAASCCVETEGSKSVGVLNEGSKEKPSVSQSSCSKRRRCNTIRLGDNFKVPTQKASERDMLFALSSTRLSRIQRVTHELMCIVFPCLQPHLSLITPASLRFTEIIDDIILTLEQSDTEEADKHCEDMREVFENLSMDVREHVPVFSPQVVLCSSPQHSLEDFIRKICSLLQLILPDLTVSLTQTFLHSPDQLESFLNQVIMSNKTKGTIRLG